MIHLLYCTVISLPIYSLIYAKHIMSANICICHYVIKCMLSDDGGDADDGWLHMLVWLSLVLYLHSWNYRCGQKPHPFFMMLHLEPRAPLATTVRKHNYNTLWVEVPGLKSDIVDLPIEVVALEGPLSVSPLLTFGFHIPLWMLHFWFSYSEVVLICFVMVLEFLKSARIWDVF